MNRSWVHLLLVGGLDMTWAIILFGRTDITISSLCKIAMDADPLKLAKLKLWKWQLAMLRWLGARLGHDHCNGAALADRVRAQAVIDLLS
jgi:hypothetical protein